jgi:pimeloyl-ACP methyl ester carboxylesterase
VGSVDEDTPYWKRERVSFAAAYGDERVSGYFYIPKNAKPPYQTIIYVSPTSALLLPSLQPHEVALFDDVVKSGRAFLVPVLKGHYQRRYAGPAAGPNAARDRLILESKDFRRSIDYLVSRPDVDRERLGLYAMSRGLVTPVVAVGERRLKAAVLLDSGLYFNQNQLPEADPFNFLPRFHVPILMGNGRFDFVFPLETTILPMFRLFGAPDKDKRLFLWNGGHLPPSGQKQVNIKETLDWYDRYLGPVK